LSACVSHFCFSWQSSLTSFFFGKQKERDDGNKENQPELIKDRKRTRQPSINKGSDMKVKENMNRTSSG
jgi:hypothetical protein